MHLPLAALAIAALLATPLACFAQDTPPPPRSAGAIGALVDAVQAGDVEAVTRLRDAAGPVGVRIATWRILRGGIAGDLPTYAAFDDTHADWPGMDLLRQRAESRLGGQPAQAVLDGDHYALDKVKDRIVEYLAVQARTNQLKGPILCLVGPPGVGKTSLLKALAGAHPRSGGKIILGGDEVGREPPQAMAKRGLGFVPQGRRG